MSSTPEEHSFAHAPDSDSWFYRPWIYRYPNYEPEVAYQEEQSRVERYIAGDYLWHGRDIETAEEASDWLESLSDESIQEDLGGIPMSYAISRALFRQFGRLDVESDGQPSTQLGSLVNDLRRNNALKNLSESLLKTAATGLGVANSSTFRLFYHAGVEMTANDPNEGRSMYNFMSMLDNINQPLKLDKVVVNLQVPISMEDTRHLQAVANLTADCGENTELDATVAITNALAGTYNLLKFIHEQRPAGDEASNAQKIVQTLEALNNKKAYAGLQARTDQVPHIPYTSYIKLANHFTDAITKTEGPLARLDEESIRDLPQALDRILLIACLGNVSGVIADNSELQTTISTARTAIDNVIGLGVTRKLGPTSLTLQDIVVALRTYLPPNEVAAAVQRLSEDQEGLPASRDALRRRIAVGRQRWVEDKLKAPGRGKLS